MDPLRICKATGSSLGALRGLIIIRDMGMIRGMDRGAMVPIIHIREIITIIIRANIEEFVMDI